MSVQRLALSNILRNSPRLVTLPHQVTTSQNENEEENPSSTPTSRLIDAVIPLFNLLNPNNQATHFNPNLSNPYLYSFEVLDNSLKPISNGSVCSKNLRKVSKTLCKSAEVSCQTDVTGDGKSSDGVGRLDELAWDLENKIGEELMETGMRTEAVRRFKNAAEHGNVEAMYNYGDCLFYGIGITSNKLEAFYNWADAAELGHAASMYSLALCYLRGEGTEKDEELSLKWMKEAAKRADSDAAFYMIVHYMRLEQPNEARAFIATACKKEEYKKELHSWLSDKCLSDDCSEVIARVLGN